MKLVFLKRTSAVFIPKENWLHKLKVLIFKLLNGSHRRCSVKKAVLCKFPRKTPVLESLFNKGAGMHLY